MRVLDPQWVAALVLMAMALVVSAGLPIAPKWRRLSRAAAIGVFILALMVVLIEIARWLVGG
jgi:hypothetical protein